MAQANVSTLPVTHEDLSDELVLLEPDEMVFSSIVKVGKPATHDLFSAPVDSRIATGLGGLPDGSAVNRSNVTNMQGNRAKIPGCIQHYRVTHGVSTLAMQTLDPAGIEDAFVDGRVKALTALKQNMEWTNLSEQIGKEGSTSVGFQTQGALGYIRSTAQPNTDLLVPTAFRTPTAQCVTGKSSADAILESEIRTMLMECRRSRHKPVNLTAFSSLEFGNRMDTFFTALNTSDTPNSIPTRQFVSQGDADTYEVGVTRYKTRYGSVDVVGTTYLNAVSTLQYGPEANGANGVGGNGSTAGAATTNGSTNVAFTSTLGMQPYMSISGTGIPANAYIVSITNSTTVVISAAATATGTPTVTIGKTYHVLFADMEFFEVRRNMAPSAYELAADGSGRQGVVEGIEALFCGLPTVHGFFSN